MSRRTRSASEPTPGSLADLQAEADALKEELETVDRHRRQLVKSVERARVESLGSKRMPGMANNLTAKVEDQYGHGRFAHVTEDREWAQPVAVINYPQTEDYTRVTEYKHLTGQVHPKTSLTYEYPSDTGDPYYPVPRPENEALYKRYQALADATRDVWFAGRLATYRYYNMDQVTAQALTTFARIDAALGPRTEAGGRHLAKGLAPGFHAG